MSPLPAQLAAAAVLIGQDVRAVHGDVIGGYVEDSARAHLEAALAVVDPDAPGATHPDHWRRHGHEGRPCPPYGCYGGATDPDGLRAEVERLNNQVARMSAGNLSMAERADDRLTAARSEVAALRAGVEALRTDLRRAYPDPAPYTTEATTLARLDALLAEHPTPEASAPATCTAHGWTVAEHHGTDCAAPSDRCQCGMFDTTGLHWDTCPGRTRA